jgi:hypothetical protein
MNPGKERQQGDEGPTIILKDVAVGGEVKSDNIWTVDFPQIGSSKSES